MRFLTHHRANLYGLKIRFPPGSVGSSPTSDTKSARPSYHNTTGHFKSRCKPVPNYRGSSKAFS